VGKILTITAGLIAVYLIVANATNAGKFLTAAGGVYQGSVRVLQGRG
jgi:hypothetical protein